MSLANAEDEAGTEVEQFGGWNRGGAAVYMAAHRGD